MEKLEKHYKKLGGGKAQLIKNGLLAKMLSYVSTYIMRQSDEYVRTITRIENTHKSENRPTIPEKDTPTGPSVPDEDDAMRSLEEHDPEEIPLTIN
jgi:hypothetical protein